ncbi:YHS domain-containing protein [Sedimenticola selenatireducens]|uniref:YHS domain-containing protein n=1 Tax=Sedimenticola selenatireducens TaxID=191960 RepID=UPI0004B8A5E9|nr:YHS domain-containing protein [Sedimenticola selenatireducens]
MEGLLWFLILGGLFYFMMRFGCGAHMVHGHGGRGGHAGHGNGEGEHSDPVCGMTVAADQGYGKMHQGMLYRFCSRNCLDKFEADPGKYLKPTGDTGGAT